ncbi:DUF4238 domain-containing protein [Marinicellulosiphila megalodicopiae]|uniref:DUF4238 domain-containing protein n=1 Tax=Marinicellulosiphila megalodicopiae TaxID=2724896 RepID=UPI003BAF9675
MSKDHYVPQFYLRRWARDGIICSAKWEKKKGELYWKSLSTASVGYKSNLYEQVEKKFFMPLDTKAAKFINLFNEFDGQNPRKKILSKEDSELWAKYILAQYIRTPNNVDSICNNFAKVGMDIISAKDQLPSIIENKRAVRDLCNMQWVFATISTDCEIITSDNPLIFKPNNLAHKSCVIILPMGPKSFFLATHSQNMPHFEMNQRKMVACINQEILISAKERVFIRSKSSIQESFIKKHWPVCT